MHVNALTLLEHFSPLQFILHPCNTCLSDRPKQLFSILFIALFRSPEVESGLYRITHNRQTVAAT